MIREAIRKYAHPKANKEWSNAVRGYLPLTPSILKEFEEDVKNVYHVCSIYSLDRIIKQQGKRIDISTFSKGSFGIATGAVQDAEILIVLDGNSSFRTGADMENSSDRNQHKWLTQYNGSKGVIRLKFSRVMTEKIVNYLDVTWNDDLYDIVKNFTGKEKSKFVKWYYDETKKLLTKKLLTEIKNDFILPVGDDIFDNDEILLHNFKIKSVYTIRLDEDEEVDDDWLGLILNKLKKNNISYLGWINRKETAKLGR